MFNFIPKIVQNSFPIIPKKKIVQKSFPKNVQFYSQNYSVLFPKNY